MSIASVVLRGFGNGTVIGSIGEIVVRGYSIGEELSVWTKQTDATTSWAAQTDETTTWSAQTDESTTWTTQ